MLVGIVNHASPGRLYKKAFKICTFFGLKYLFLELIKSEDDFPYFSFVLHLRLSLQEIYIILFCLIF